MLFTRRIVRLLRSLYNLSRVEQGAMSTLLRVIPIRDYNKRLRDHPSFVQFVRSSIHAVNMEMIRQRLWNLSPLTGVEAMSSVRGVALQ